MNDKKSEKELDCVEVKLKQNYRKRNKGGSDFRFLKTYL